MQTKEQRCTKWLVIEPLSASDEEKNVESFITKQFFLLTISEFNCVPLLQRSGGKTLFDKPKTPWSKLTADSMMPVSANRGPLNMGTTLASRITQYSSKDSWLNWSASVTISSSSSSSSLAWEALLSDRLELDWSSLEFKQTVVPQLHSQHYLTMLEVTLSTQGWNCPWWFLHHFLHLPLVIQRTFLRAPFLGYMLCVRGLRVVKRESLSERYNPIIVQGNSEQKLELYHLCWLTTKLKCNRILIFSQDAVDLGSGQSIILKSGQIQWSLLKMVIVGNATNISVCLGDVSAEEWQGWPMYNDSVYLTKLSAMA